LVADQQLVLGAEGCWSGDQQRRQTKYAKKIWSPTDEEKAAMVEQMSEAVKASF
jgi:hypothetical protein